MSSASELESRANKKLRSFALFPSKKREKYESAYALFGAAARAWLLLGVYERAAECLKQQARLAINKLLRPVESAAHYMEATRAYMLAGELTLAFEMLQLAVSARTKPGVKHKPDLPADLSVSGITVTADGPAIAGPYEPASPGSADATTPGVLSTPPRAASSSPQHPAIAALKNNASTRSPALTGQAGTISIEGRGLYLSPETMVSPISNAAPPVTRTISISSSSHATTSSGAPSIGLFGPSAGAHSLHNHTSSSAAAPASSPSPDFLQLPPAAIGAPQSNGIVRQRRHSLSGSANSSNITSDGVHVDVLHLDLLLARLAVQLAADLYSDLDFRDAILALEIASSLFATLLIAERNIGGAFRRTTARVPSGSLSRGAPGAAASLLLPLDHPVFNRAESATVSQPTTPRGLIETEQEVLKASEASKIEERLAGLLGVNAYTLSQTTQSLGALTLSSKPLTSKPIPSLVSSPKSNANQNPSTLVLHTQDPHLSVGEGESLFSMPPSDPVWPASSVGTTSSQARLSSSDPGTSILEESLVCRFMLAQYYASWDEELGQQACGEEGGRSEENQELRRAKALFEQIASQKPDEGLVHATLLPILAEAMFDPASPPAYPVSTAMVDHFASLVAKYAADEDKLIYCLFLAGLCDALIGVRVYQASQALPPPVIPATALAAKASKKAGGVPRPPKRIPDIPELYLQARVIHCPPILLRYREMSPSFGVTPEIRLLRAINGLLQMAANLPFRLNDAFGGRAPHAAKQLFQAAWGAEILREYSEVVAVYNKQRPLAGIVAKMLFALKREFKHLIQM